MSNAGTYETKL